MVVVGRSRWPSGEVASVRCPSPDRLITRPHLTSVLDRVGLPGEASVAVVTAPPGFGKSTLVRTWADATERPVAVLRATPGLGTPFELWSAVASALSEVVDPETAETLHRHRADPGALGRDGVPAAVLGAVTGRAAVLVLDDLHHIRCPALLAEVDRMIEKSPGHLGLVLVGRGGLTRPTLHDLYLRGELASVGLKLLAFTRDEVDACCARLSRSGRDRVWEWTQGWPAMVQVLQRALVDGADPASPLGALDGLVDHLFADVFEHIDAATQQLLLLASVVDPMPLHLLVRLADRADAGAVLHEVAQRSGLVDEGLDDEGARSFRLHPLLRGHLRATLDRGDAEAAGIAQVSAARWFRDRGEVIGAVRHAVRAGGQELDKTLAVLGQAGVNEGLAEPLLETIAPASTTATSPGGPRPSPRRRSPTWDG